MEGGREADHSAAFYSTFIPTLLLLICTFRYINTHVGGGGGGISQPLVIKKTQLVETGGVETVCPRGWEGGGRRGGLFHLAQMNPG